MRTNEERETFKKRWRLLRDSIWRLDPQGKEEYAKERSLRCKDSRPRVKRAGTPYLAGLIAAHGAAIAGETARSFGAQNLQRWDNGTSQINKSWHFHTLERVLLDLSWSSNGLADLIFHLNKPEMPDSEWESLLEYAKPDGRVKWNEKEGRWALVRMLRVDLPHTAVVTRTASAATVAQIMEIAQCRCPAMERILRGVEDDVARAVLDSAKRLP